MLADSINEGVYKIGVTTNTVDKRIKELQTGNAGEIYVCRKFETDYPFLIEKKLHLKYCGSNIKNEWFRLSDEDANNFIKNCEIEERAIKSLEENPFFNKKKKR